MTHTQQVGMEFMFTEEELKTVEEIKSHYPTSQAALLPVLWLAQKKYGWISEELMKYVAKLLEVPYSHVLGVVTFYSMFNKKPVGKYHLQVCTNISCQLMGAETLLEHIEKQLHIRPGETTADGRFTLSEVECLGSCGAAPTIQINDDYYEALTPEKLDSILRSLR